MADLTPTNQKRATQGIAIATEDREGNIRGFQKDRP